MVSLNQQRLWIGKCLTWLLLLAMLFMAADADAARRRIKKKRTQRDPKDKAAIEQAISQNQERLLETQRILEETKAKRENSLGQLKALTEQVRGRTQLISTMSREITQLQNEVAEIETRIGLLQSDLIALREEYKSMVYAASKANSYNKLMFLFSSQDFNQLVMRIRYLKHYSEARKQQFTEIVELSTELNDEKTALNQRAMEKEQLLNSQLTESEKLKREQQEQQQLVKKLSKEERKLRAEINRRQEQDRRLESMLEAAIKREMRRAMLENRRRKAAEAAKAKSEDKKPTEEPEKKEPTKEKEAEADESRMELTPEGEMLSKDFAAHKRRLTWPVQQGFISLGFGKQSHPVLPQIIIDNHGIDIQTPGGEKVLAVFEGVVGFVMSFPGMPGQSIAIQHGNYFTVYNNVENITVKPGEKVRFKDILGRVATDSEGGHTLRFQVWNKNNRLNPQSWLKSK